ncbi:hypothetical protein FVB9288_02877 [Flavobacterium sp. CECT 9288]|nr:hypothetical protein FVB9288_02877 [Flavobacterium sp. CECT 9288]
MISLILCSSCSKDNYDNYDTIKGANNVIYEIPIAELNTDNVFKAIFSKKFNNRSFENFLVNKNDYKLKSTNEFFIPEKNAVVSKTDSLISYTMLIKRNSEKVNYFENLVIQINSKNQYSANIIRYYPKSFEINKDHNSFSLIADKQLVPLNQEAGKKIKNSMRSDNQTCISVSYSVCNQGGKDHIAGENCTKIYRDVSNTVCFETETGGGDYGGIWGWNYSNGITFPGSGDGLEHGDNPFTITTAPIDPRLDIGIEGSIIYDESYDAFFSQIFYNNLGELKTWADQNRDLYNIILNNVINDQWSAKSLKFANFAIKFLNDNSEVTWEQFENWFMGTPEGQDGEYDAAFWENPNLTFQQQSLPSYNNYVNNMARFADGTLMKGADNIYTLVGGKVLEARLKDKDGTENTCALKVSIALVRSDIVIPNLPGITLEGSDEFSGKFFFLNAKELNAWMRKTFGTNTGIGNTPINDKHLSYNAADGGQNGEDFPNKLKNIRGIYSMITTEDYDKKGASGHADLLFTNIAGFGTCVFDCFFNLPIQRIDLWILN